MKKLVFSAMVSIAFVGSAFASNEIVREHSLFVMDKNDFKPKKPCKVSVYVIAPNGEKMWKTGEGGSLTWEECGKFKDSFVAETAKLGYELIDDNVTVIWGN